MTDTGVRPAEWEAIVTVRVKVTINDDNVIARCVENQDGWRDHYYPYDTEDEVIKHLAYNCVANGIEHPGRLDGWADLPDSAATAMAVEYDIEDVRYLGGGPHDLTAGGEPVE